MKVIHHTNCPICGNDNLSTFFQGKDFFSSQEDFKIVVCSECGFRLTQDFPDEKEIGDYYHSEDYISHSDTQKGVVNSFYHQARRFMLKMKADEIEKRLPFKGDLLDIGCGTGYFSGYMSHRNWHVTAIEKDDATREFAQKKWGLKVLPSDTLKDLESNSFDAITLWHVLEHIQSLNETMEQIYRILKDDGIAFIALPNCSSYDAQHYQMFWAAYDLPRHLWHFNPMSFKRLAEKHDFFVERPIRMPLDVFYISMLSEKYKDPFGTNVENFLKGMLQGSIGCVKSIINSTETSSLIYILRKK